MRTGMKKLAILVAMAAMTMALAAGPASADEIIFLDDDGDIDEVVHDLDGLRFFGDGVVFFDDCEGPICFSD